MNEGYPISPGKRTYNRVKFIVLFALIAYVAVTGSPAVAQKVTSYRLDTTTFFDQSRKRAVPVALYRPEKPVAGIVIFSHGYAENRPGTYLHYTYLTSYLAGSGYFVVSIQHELPTDSLIPSAGVPQVVRRPFWDRGADNILFVINELKKRYPDLNFNRITLIGHSNGGDMTALFPRKYPGISRKIITLDNRRMPLPRSSDLKIYSLRSSDQPADPGVLPTEAEQKKYKMKIVRLAETAHNDMDDHADDRQRAEILGYILRFLQEQ